LRDENYDLFLLVNAEIVQRIMRRTLYSKSLHIHTPGASSAFITSAMSINMEDPINNGHQHMVSRFLHYILCCYSLVLSHAGSLKGTCV